MFSETDSEKDAESETQWEVSLHCTAQDPATVAKVAEVFARTMTGLALEGLSVTMHIDKDEPWIHDDSSED